MHRHHLVSDRVVHLQATLHFRYPWQRIMSIWMLLSGHHTHARHRSAVASISQLKQVPAIRYTSCGFS